MDTGYIKIWRKCLYSGMLKNKNLWVFWSWCLMKASYKKRSQTVGCQEIILEPGQFVFTRKMACDELDMTDREVRTVMAAMENSEKATIKTTNKFSIVSIINWDIYQANENENDQQNDQPPTNKRPTKSGAYKRNKIYKKEGKEGKEDKDSCSDVKPYEPNTPVIPPIVTIPILQNKEEHPVYQEKIDEYSKAYPAVDIVTELHKCRQWNLANPKKQKTKTGIMRHINGWLERSQNSFHGNNQQPLKPKEFSEFD